MSDPLAIQFSDLRGFTSLTAERGDEEAFRLARTFVELVEHEVGRHGGELLKTYGDGVMTSFDDATRAVECAAAMQKSLCAEYCSADARDETISAGIGLTWGTAIRTDGDLFGNSVNLAKRLSDLAKGGQIVASVSLFEQTGDVEGFSFRGLGSRELKGLGAMDVYEVVWRPERAKLTLGDDTLDLVVTEDDKLVLEFAKPIVDTIRELTAELHEDDGDASGLSRWIKRRVARSLERSIPKMIEKAGGWAGLGIERALDEVDVGISGHELTVNLPGKKPFSFDLQGSDLDRAQDFLRTFEQHRQRMLRPGG